MELDELKNLWKAEDSELERKIKLNEEHLMKMNMDKNIGEISNIVRIALFGRNMALIYCFISIGMAVSMIEAIEYSIPAVLGALAMLWSFISHLSIETPNYNDSIVQLQKSICAFRIHLATNAKYDVLVVALWILSGTPIYLKLAFNISLYTNNQALAIFCLLAGIALTLMMALSNKIYKKHDKALKKAEANLAELIKFEKDS
ncbi:MAG: hypothetical protein EOP48_10400 [Sphingobacteriales bacterium]|nr:MAG: hypothetical protein EOP48_10400 [Sphingobacteriales bacterium]